MTVPERYKETKRLQGQYSVEIAEGIDSVTGLPVLIYRFEGTPQAGLEHFESENAPKLLWLDSSGTTTSLVTALEPNWRYRSSENRPLQPAELVDLARALRDAAAVELVHGDIRPERLLVTGSFLQIEGFGVPWQPDRGPFTPPEINGEPSEPGDVWSLSAVIRKLGTTALDETSEAVLQLCTAEDPGERPTAEELYLALERLLPEAVAAAESTSVDAAATKAVASNQSGETSADENYTEENDTEEDDIEKGDVARGRAGKDHVEKDHLKKDSAEQSKVVRGGAVKDGAVKGGAVNDSAGSGRTSRSSDDKVGGAGGGAAAGSGAGSVGGAPLRPPPVSEPTAPSASAPASGEGGDLRRRLALLGVLMAAVILLALLAVFGPRPGAVPALGRDATVYVVEFAVAPEDLPPVTIHLVSSPPGSSLSRGERLGTAPRHLALERGTWVFQGSLQERRSEPVEVRVPDQRFVTLTIPPVASGEDR